jgi:hypothetical protein
MMMRGTFARWVTAALTRVVMTGAVAGLVGSQAVDARAAPSEKSGEILATPPLHTATTHPMKYYLSLPGNWSADRNWPVLVVPSAHYPNRAKTFAMFVAERDARKTNFIIVVPLVINVDAVTPMTEYRGPVADAMKAADAADGFRNIGARTKFDAEGICAVLQDVRKLYRGEERVYLTGFSASTHVAYLLLFNHPELLKGVMINSGVYLGRGVDEHHIPYLNSPERARLPVKFINGENESGYSECVQNWEKTRAELVRYGHRAENLQREVIRKGNPEHLSAGHNWYPTRILDFIIAVERSTPAESRSAYPP